MAEGTVDAVGEGINVGAAVISVGEITAICFAGVVVASTIGVSTGVIIVAVSAAVAVVAAVAVIVASDVRVEIGVGVSTTSGGVFVGCGELHAALDSTIPKITQRVVK